MPWSLTKPQLTSLFYLAGLVSVTKKQELQASGISTKASNHPFNVSSLVFADFFTVIALLIIHEPNKRSFVIVDRSHVFTLRKVLSDLC